ncbi:MAG: PAS domain-containing protein [Rhodobacteraceae bacterium]|nr:PAS domain-containing protein [Paracoccaceae bacterium]
MTDAQIDTRPSPLSQVLRLPFALRAADPGFPAVVAVQRHWESLRDPRGVPARDAIDPRPLAQWLDQLFIAELVAPGVARIRLAGQHLSELLGMEPRGMPLSVFFTGPARDELASALAQVAQGARATLPLRADRGLGQPAMAGMLALMPLTDREGRLSRVLGVLESVGPVGRAPRRFRTTAPMRADPAAPPPAQPGQRPALRLIRGGRD